MVREHFYALRVEENLLEQYTADEIHEYDNEYHFEKSTPAATFARVYVNFDWTGRI